jgi:segregation and condensation protein B
LTEGADHLRLLEAILFASAAPVSEAELARFLPEEADVSAIVGQLAEHYRHRGVNLVQVGKAWAFRSAPDLAPLMRREQEVQRKLSRAAIETLAVVAYHQPLTRAEIEEIRGVGLSKGTLDVLLEAGWIRPRGRRRTPGRPVTWGTSQAFLDHFGLAQLDDLPGLEELAAAGLLDKRPALAALSSRGNLTDLSDAQDTEPLAEDEEDQEDEDSDALEAGFGEDLVAEPPEDGEDTAAAQDAPDEEAEEDAPQAGQLRQVEA